MRCFPDCRIVLFGVALLIACGCDKTESAKKASTENQVKPKPALVEHETTKTPNSVAAKPDVSKSTVVLAVTENKDAIKKSLVIAEANEIVSPTTVIVPSDSGENVPEVAINSEPTIPAKRQEPVTIERVFKTLDFADLPRPKNVERDYMYPTILSYDTTSDFETTQIAVFDEMLKRGFTAGDSTPSRYASITIKLESKPMTIFLMNSSSGTSSQVSMYHHQGVDISSVPQLPTEGVVDQRVDHTFYQSAVGVREGQHQLRKKIGNANIPIARTTNSNGTLTKFEKEGLEFICNVEETESMEFETPGQPPSKKTHVHIACVGNCDIESLPRPDGFESPVQAFNSGYGSHRFIASSKPGKAVNDAIELLQASGWKPAESMRANMGESHRSLIRDGVFLQIYALQFGADRTHVTYNQSLLAFDLPRNIETRMIRADNSVPRLFFTTSASVEDVAKFYTKHLPAIGWKEKQEYLQTSTDHHRQLFDGYYHDPLFLDIEKKGPDSTWVNLSPIEMDEVASAFSTPQEKDPAVQASLDTVEAAADSGFNPPTASDIAAQSEAMDDLDVPDSPEEIMALAEQQIEEALKDVPAEQANEFRKLMKGQLEALNQATGELDTQFDVAPVTETIASSPDASDDWGAKEKPEAKVPAGKIAAADFPVPPDAKNVTRDVGMITYKTDTVEKNAKFLTDKLKALDWKPRGEQIIETDLGYLQFQKGTDTIKSTLTLDDRNDPPVHVIIHGDGIWFGDEELFGGEFDGEMEAEGDAGFNDGFEDGFEERPTQFEGLPLPLAIEAPFTGGSRFRSELTTSVEADLESTREFFRTSATESNWKTISNIQIDKQNVVLTLDNGLGEMIVGLQQHQGEVEIRLAFRDPKLAGEQGFVPPKGSARLILANISEAETTIVINNKDYKLAPEQGAENPKDGIKVDLKPGEYTYTVKGPGRKEQTDKLKVVAGGSWGVVVFPEEGHMAERMY